MASLEPVIDQMESAMVVARWAPAGREGLVQGGAWGWALAKDWGPERMGQAAWLAAKEQCALRAPTYHLAAIEDALGVMLDRVCEAGRSSGLFILSAELRAMGPPQGRRVEAVCSYRSTEDAPWQSKKAVDLFFEGLPHASQRWAQGGDDGSNSFAMRARLLDLRRAWMERIELDEEGTESTKSGRSGRI